MSRHNVEPGNTHTSKPLHLKSHLPIDVMVYTQPTNKSVTLEQKAMVDAQSTN